MTSKGNSWMQKLKILNHVFLLNLIAFLTWNKKSKTKCTGSTQQIGRKEELDMICWIFCYQKINYSILFLILYCFCVPIFLVCDISCMYMVIIHGTSSFNQHNFHPFVVIRLKFIVYVGILFLAFSAFNRIYKLCAV